MISFEAAQCLIQENLPLPKSRKLPIEESLGYVLAENVCSQVNLPIADNSAMDGFVLCSEETKMATPEKPAMFKIRGSIKAGDGVLRVLKPGQAFRMMTGAFIPKGGDTVLPKEEAELDRNFLKIKSFIPLGKHVRYQGEEIKKRSIVLKKNSKIYPITIGILASIGKKNVRVFKKPSVSLVTTGSELVQPGKVLTRGKIYDSNSFMLKASLKEMGIVPNEVLSPKDHPHHVRRAIRRALKASDVLILTGGVSVGDYDFVKEVLAQEGVQTIFWKVEQKPGKPLYFGRKGKQLIFGLPGNPASVYTCFYEYVFPALRKIAGMNDPFLVRKVFKMQEDVLTDANKIQFLRAKTGTNGSSGTVELLSRRGSHMISSLQESDGFVLLRPSGEKIKRGEKVEVDLLPRGNGYL